MKNKHCEKEDIEKLKDQINDLSKKGIKKSTIAYWSNISPQYLNRVLKHEQPLPLKKYIDINSNVNNITIMFNLMVESLNLLKSNK